jgi:GTP cyclohydrolase I/GTP cyclohydrolase-4
MGDCETLLPPDVQGRTPTTRLGLSRAGVSRSTKALAVRLGDSWQSLRVRIECFVDLGAEQKGVHMSRFEEVVNEAIEAAAAGEPVAIDILAERITREIVSRQGAGRGETTVRADYPVMRTTPVTGLPSQETYELIGVASADGPRARRLMGAAAHGLNACPCAQELVRAGAERRLADAGFSADEIERALEVVPGATHNQRARGTLLVGTPSGAAVDPDLLIRIIEDGMSSETYELMKRPDEQWVVEKAHRRPRFVEDSVREMIRGVVELMPELPDDAFVSAQQENYETIHAHDVEAERFGVLGEIRRELAGEPTDGAHLSREEWLAGL